MCGIAGIIHADPFHPVSPQAIRKMCDAIVHRGPDDFGMHVEGHVGIGMRRLSIIDLHSGDQPIPNEDRSLWIVFNGEIYNYRLLRQELEEKGHCFRTTSDTEVIIHLYEELGVDCVNRLEGMFAFAIWNSCQDSVMLARDRLGIKPLYYAETPDGLIFGSELKALLTYPGACRDLSVDAMAEYFTHLCVPGDLSIYQAIKKLPPAHVLTYRDKSLHLNRYWHVRPTSDERFTEQEWIEQLRARLKDAVESHMIADVPVGAFLSGGLDSGAMVALMAQASSQPIRTFTVGFSTDAGRFDERESAATVAARYRTNHHECLLEADVRDVLPKIVSAFDEPFADSSAIPNWLVSQETARHVKVALSGLGADELFGGYERYMGLQLGESFQRIPRVFRRAAVMLLESLPIGNGMSNWPDRIKRFLAAGELSLPDRYRSFIAAFLDARSILHPDVNASLRSRTSRYDEVVNALAVDDPLNFGLFADLYLYLPDDLLPLSDRMSMAHSLEIRVPFLDHRLVEFVARMPSHFKVRGLQKKYLFRKAIGPWLPPEHFTQPKQGFSVPLTAWLRGSLRPIVEDLAYGHQWRSSPWLNHSVVEQLVREHLSGAVNHESRLWAVICFREWEQQHRNMQQVLQT
ncbi:MAG: asparagine synthase (glutamine-hydrolyzing) [Nitrospiraceae bacterium]|nr:asparagine synthase (glutamine-hydrolyzing) [Nitrospiraceae bacterium]